MHLGAYSVGHLSCVVWALMWPCVGIDLGPTWTMGTMALDPDVSQMLFSPGHQHRSIAVMSQVYIHCGAGPPAVLWDQFRLWPGPTASCACLQSLQLLKPDWSWLPEPRFHPDVLSGLSLQSQLWGVTPWLSGCKERFQLFFLRGERVTGRKARGLQMEEIAGKCQTFLFLLSGRRKQTRDIVSFSIQI